MASKTLIDQLSQRIDRLEAVLKPPPPAKWVVVLQFDDEADEDMRRKYPSYDPRRALHLEFDDCARTEPAAEVTEPALTGHAHVPQVDELVKAFDISTD